MLRVENIAGHSYVGDWLRASPVVVDLGANAGLFSLTAIERYGARVYAAEAEPRLCKSLSSLNNPKLSVRHAALASRNGEIALNVWADRCASVFHELAAGEQSQVTLVPTITLSDFFDEIKLPEVDLMKVDIEGSELEVLGQASDNLLLKVKQITVEFHEFLYPEMHTAIDDLKRRFRRLGFYVVDFSLINGDVLFINPEIKVAKWMPVYLHGVKYKRGIIRKVARVVRGKD
jgi:FkbM family methyltransferase